MSDTRDDNDKTATAPDRTTDYSLCNDPTPDGRTCTLPFGHDENTPCVNNPVTKTDR